MTIIFLVCAWFVGLAAGTFSELPGWAWPIGTGGGLVLTLLWREEGRKRLWAACLVALCLGASRMASATPAITPDQIAYYNDLPTATVVGLVSAEPTISASSMLLRVEARTIALEDGQKRPVAGLFVIVAPRFASVRYGDLVQARGVLEATAVPSSHPTPSYLARQGVLSQMRWPELRVLGQGQGSWWRPALISLRDRARSTIHQLLPDPAAALLTGILVGDESGLSRRTAEQFRTTGMTHIIAISGFNIALLAGALLAIGRRPFGWRAATWLALVGVALYTLLVGAEPAVVRAAIMAGLFLFSGRLLGRPTFAPAGLFTAGLIMTLIEPEILWQVGFQLSFAATLGLMVYLAPWQARVLQLGERIASPSRARLIADVTAEVLLATLAAQLLVLPILAFHFGQISLVNLPANLLILPAQSGIMLFGGLAVLAGWAVPIIGQAFAWLAWLFLTYTTRLVDILAQVPYAAVSVKVTPAGMALIYGLIAGLTWLLQQSPNRRTGWLEKLPLIRRGHVVLGGSVLAILLVGAWARSQPDGKLHAAFLDVGQGDAIFLQTPSGRQILVDSGRYPAVLFEQLGRQMPFWDRHIDLVIATHPDADHVSALPDLLDRYRVGTLLTDGQPGSETSGGLSAYDLLLKEAGDQGVPIHIALAGEVIRIDDGVQLEILHPDRFTPLSDRNEHSVVLRLTYGDFILLLTGDAGSTAEQAMLQSGRPLQATVLKAGHHGANTSTSAAFLAAVHPQIVVISAGADNRFGHPHPEMLERVANSGATLLRTDTLGAIEVETDGHQMTWQAVR